MFSFLFLINNSATVGLRFLLLSIYDIAILSLKSINIWCTIFGFYSSMFL